MTTITQKEVKYVLLVLGIVTVVVVANTVVNNSAIDFVYSLFCIFFLLRYLYLVKKSN